MPECRGTVARTQASGLRYRPEWAGKGQETAMLAAGYGKEGGAEQFQTAKCGLEAQTGQTLKESELG